MTQLLEGAKLAAGAFLALCAVIGVLALAWLVWKRALLEAERVVSETWKRIAEGYEEEVKQLRQEVGALRRELDDTKEAIDTYGCENAPTCERRMPRRRLALDPA